MKTSTKNQKPPKLKIEITATDRFIEALTVLLLLITWFMAVWFFSKLPETVPSHIDTTGKVTEMNSKWTLFFIPSIITVIIITLRILSRYPHVYNYPLIVTEERAPRVYAFSTKMVRSLNFGIGFFFCLTELMIISVAQGRNPQFGILLIPLIFISALTFLIYSIRKLFILGKVQK